MKPRILVVGSSNTDMIIKVPQIPRPGQTLLGREFLTAAGGKGANQAVGAARAGGNVTFIARVGSDMFGDQAVAGFARDQINVSYISRDPRTPSGVALIFVATNGENCIGVAGGANSRLSPEDVRRADAAFASATVLVMQLETPLPTVVTAANLAAKHGLRVILNPAPALPLPDRLLKLVSILTPNETEAESLTGIKVNNLKSAARAAAQLQRRGVPTVIITLGARGAFVANRDGSQLVRGYRVKPVDTTAAGDIFNGALAVALGEGRGLTQAARFANAAAAISVTRSGAQPSAPTRAEILRFLARQH